jgi:hypothetical protein
MPQQQTVKPKFECDACGERYTWKPGIAGRQAKCKCGAVLTVPMTNPLEQPPEEQADPDVPQFEDYDVAEGQQEEEPAPPPPLPPPPVPARAGKTSPAKSSGAKATAGGGLFSSINAFIPDNDNWKWWYYPIAGVLLIGVAFYEYFKMLDYETGESARLRLKGFERMLYGIFGKWGVVGFLVFLATIMLVIGYAKFANRKEQEA